MSNPLHKFSFIFNVIQGQLIAIRIITLLIVKNIKKKMSKNVKCLKMFSKLW
jgi:ethanolamine transporter EutH